MALVELRKHGYVRYLVSCNVDCLHLRSGFPREYLAELHGNCFAERCERCEKEYIRDFEMSTVGFEYTGRTCDKCGAFAEEAKNKRKRASASDSRDAFAPRRSSRASTSRSQVARLRDQVLDWDDALPPDELRCAEKHSRETCLSLVLGSSLQITPSCDIPLLTVRKRKGKRGKLVIVNLQETPKDRMATMLVRAKTDVVMAGVMRRLGLTVPEYVRYDRVVVGARLFGTPADPERRTFAVRVGSSHGWDNPVPWLAGVSFTIRDGGGLENRPQSRFELLDARTRDALIADSRMADGYDDEPDKPETMHFFGGPCFETATRLSDEEWNALLEGKRNRARFFLTLAEGCTERRSWFEVPMEDLELETGHESLTTHSVMTSRRRYEDRDPDPGPAPARRDEKKKKLPLPRMEDKKQKNEAPDPVAARIRAAIAMR
jgi:NAD-dependent SIR2 family protein deacetylase